ncbi:glycerophosphodiester phosphodiesterase [Candidatus Viridilinea mediisalina]|uniref:Glycerophosphodiester phosphodiesterase n=1 Tax=Candidatus Viridilinea mediisalina TaxID=2024553 RepID=A0A2A6RJZ0_9CHLR|nr:glycerophosphodiester phosphodiesterase [Candidatus Viridilinea mediisalina]PDW03199.1 glycerophosphodiester phosphodiesterase [Candidatus Viridilinea mediisalina]
MNTPMIIAHRGASGEAPENTMAAFELAQRQGAAMLELDLQRSADGYLVVFHDATTEHWERQGRPVATCSLKQLQQLDIGGERVPTLAAVLDFARTSGILLNIELKAHGMATACAKLVRQYQLSDRVLISSFYPQALQELQRTAPELQRGYLMGIRTWRPNVRLREFWPFFALRSIAAHTWHPYEGLPGLDRIIPLARRAGYGVNVWTVDQPERMRRLATLGVTGIITNYPALGKSVIPINSDVKSDPPASHSFPQRDSGD